MTYPNTVRVSFGTGPSITKAIDLRQRENDYNPKTKRVEPIKMPRNYVIEMFCDRVAAGKIYMGEKYDPTQPLAYFERGKDRRFIHPETSGEIEMLLRMLAEKGEEETFAFIRKWRKENKK